MNKDEKNILDEIKNTSFTFYKYCTTIKNDYNLSIGATVIFSYLTSEYDENDNKKDIKSYQIDVTGNIIIAKINQSAIALALGMTRPTFFKYFTELLTATHNKKGSKLIEQSKGSYLIGNFESKPFYKLYKPLFKIDLKFKSVLVYGICKESWDKLNNVTMYSKRKLAGLLDFDREESVNLVLKPLLNLGLINIVSHKYKVFEFTMSDISLVSNFVKKTETEETKSVKKTGTDCKKNRNFYCDKSVKKTGINKNIYLKEEETIKKTKEKEDEFPNKKEFLYKKAQNVTCSMKSEKKKIIFNLIVNGYITGDDDDATFQAFQNVNKIKISPLKEFYKVEIKIDLMDIFMIEEFLNERKNVYDDDIKVLYGIVNKIIELWSKDKKEHSLSQFMKTYIKRYKKSVKQEVVNTDINSGWQYM